MKRNRLTVKDHQDPSGGHDSILLRQGLKSQGPQRAPFNSELEIFAKISIWPFAEFHRGGADDIRVL